jgi:hypothetical protein
MARPITWQNVNSPQGALSIEALLRSGRQAGEGFETMGNVFKTARDEMQQAATGAAVAQIANAQDPTAVAAAAPQTWQFDPLAIASAANARKEQLGEEEVRQSNLATDLLQRQATQSELKDREDKRLGALAASKGFEYIDKTGKIPEFAADDPLAGTQAGIYAQEAWREYQKEKKSFDLDKERLGLERARAAREARMEKQSKAEQGYLAELNDLALKPENFNMEPGARAKLNMEVAKKWGVGHLALKGDEHFSNAIKSNLPTAEQLDTIDDNGYRRSDVISGFTAAKADIDARKNIDLAQFDVAKQVALQSAASPYKGLTEEQQAQKFLETHQKELNEGWWGSKWEAKDVNQRADAIQRLARKEGLEIARHDAVEMVAATIGNATFADGEWSVKNDQVDSLIKRYGEFAKYGSVENLQLTISQREAAAAAEAAKVDRAINAVMRSAVTGEAVDKEIAKQYESTPAAKKAVLEAEVKSLEATLAEKTMIPYGTKGRDEAIARTTRQLQAAQSRLERITGQIKPDNRTGSW